ncbi:MAG: ABC transporter substrate-binding protein [bacterium]|nr:ABC transporter substrate-binding protein [bacterium]
MKYVIGVALAALAVGLLVEAFAYTTWTLARATQTRDAALQQSHADDVPRAPVGNHTIAEWPEDRGRTFSESPLFAERVAAGELPPVADRLPEDPLVIVPPEQCGPYGSTWARYATSVGDVSVFQARLAYEGLVRWDAMGREIIPNIAKRWEVSEDGRSFTFWLRRGIRWSDGEPFTADDIMFWYDDVVCNDEFTPVKPMQLQPGDDLAEIEKVDDYTIRVTFSEPNGLFMQQMASGYSYVMVTFAEHYFKQFHPGYVPEEELLEQAQAEGLNRWRALWDARAKYHTNRDMPHLWAWGVETPAPAQPVVFARNPYYWKVDPEGNQLPYIDEMTFDIYDPELINLKAIEGAIGMQLRHIQFEKYPLLKSKQTSGGYRVLEWPNGGSGTLNLGLNLNHPEPVMHDVINDDRFRKALSHAINRQELNNVGYYGLGAPSQCCPPPTSKFYVPEYETAYTEFDPDEANRLLDEIGLDKRDGSGVRLRPDGQPIHIFIDVPNMLGNIQLLELVASHWTNVGVKTDVKILARELFYMRKDGAMHDCAVWWFADEQVPTIDPRWFLPFSTESLQGVGYARWFMSFGESGIEPSGDILKCIQLYRKIMNTPDEDEQIRLFKEIIEYNRKNLWVIALVGRVPAPGIVQNDFRNVPDKAISGWIFRTPGNAAPECFAIEADGGEGP